MTTPPGTPVLAPAPGTTPGPGANTGHHYHSHTGRRLDLIASALERAGKGYDAWLNHIWPAAACVHPIRLHGQIRHVDPATGEVIRTAATATMPDEVIYKPCGNRRDRACPGCADTYRRDAFQLIRAGLTGGKGVPATVATHPAVFATFTAPSFGPVHTRIVRTCTCTAKTTCRCKAEPCHPRRDVATCSHGRTIACWRRHAPDDAPARSAAMPGLLRLRRACRLEQQHWGTMAAHQARHRTPPRRPGSPPRSAPGSPVPRQGRRIPGTRRGPLPRAAPPRRR